MKQGEPKTLPFGPLTGPLDNRSLPDMMPYGTLRTRQNFEAVDMGKICRRKGWEKLFSQTPYNNQDLHEQILGYGCTIPGVRSPLTHLKEIKATSGQRKLVAGTQSRLYCLNESTGNWKIIADGFGGAAVTDLSSYRFYSATVGDYTIFTNGYDTLRSWVFDTGAADCNSQAVKTIAELDTIKLTKAEVIVAWRGVVFLGNVEMDSERHEHRLVWSDLENPLSWLPDPGVSVAGLQDLEFGERILSMKEMGDYLIVYTTKNIWQISVVGGDAIFNFRKLYSEPATGNRCLKYRNTVVNLGNVHYYMGGDGIYAFSLYAPDPQWVDWINLATADLFGNLNTAMCNAPVSEHNPYTQEIWFSWPQAGQTTNTTSLVVNVQMASCDTVDHGFTAFVNYSADTRDTIRDFLLGNCACSLAEYVTNFGPFIKEGAFCAAESAVVCASGQPTSIYSTVPLVVGSNTTEDFNQPSASALSFCTFLNNMTFEDMCDGCDDPALFVAASATDFCLKQMGGVYYRERCTVTTGCGTYVQDGYDSILRTGPMTLGKPEELKEISWFTIKFTAETQTTPNNLAVRIGYSEAPLDPNVSSVNCGVIWRVQTPKELKCNTPTASTPAQHLTNNTRPWVESEWPLYYEGQNIYWEMKITGTGGGSCFSAVTMRVKTTPRTHWN